MVYRLPEDGRVLLKCVRVNTELSVMYIRFAYVGFINEKEAHQFRSGSAGGLTCGL